MALTNAFYQAVETGNVLRIRIMMKDSLLVDPSFEEFLEMEKIASGVENLYDKHDEKPFIVDKAFWNDDYMNKLMVKVLRNFSHERIDHIKEVVRYLRPCEDKCAGNVQFNTNRDSSGSKDNENQSLKRDSSAANNKFVIAGAVAGGAVATMVGATFIGITGGVLVGAIVGGISAKTFDNK